MTKIRLGIDGRVLAFPRTGIGNYVYGLMGALDQVMPDAEFTVFSHVPLDPVLLPSGRWRNLYPERCRIPSFLWLRYAAGEMIRDSGVEVFWGASGFLPRYRQQICTVVTAYDFNYRLFPRTMRFSDWLRYRFFWERDMRSADHVAVISQGTADKVSGYLGRPAAEVIPPAVSSLFRPADATEQNVLRGKYTLPAEYFLAVGTLEPRKNLQLLLHVFDQLWKERKGDMPQLVLVGGGGWKNRALRETLEGISAPVTPLGYVDDNDLPALYSGARALIFPSLYEGFGMPVRESLACGTPVIASNIPEIREAGGVHGVTYVDPNFSGIREGILSFLTSSREKVQNMRFPNWVDGAQRLAGLFRAADVRCKNKAI